MQNKSVS